LNVRRSTLPNTATLAALGVWSSRRH